MATNVAVAPRDDQPAQAAPVAEPVADRFTILMWEEDDYISIVTDDEGNITLIEDYD